MFPGVAGWSGRHAAGGSHRGKGREHHAGKPLCISTLRRIASLLPTHSRCHQSSAFKSAHMLFFILSNSPPLSQANSSLTYHIPKKTYSTRKRSGQVMNMMHVIFGRLSMTSVCFGSYQPLQDMAGLGKEAFKRFEENTTIRISVL